MHLAPVKQQQFKTREVLAPTPGRQPTGSDYVLTANPSYDNPVTAVHHIDENNCYLKFETQDGVTGKHNPEPSNQFTRL